MSLTSFTVWSSKRTLLDLVEQATGKSVSGRDEQVSEEPSLYDLTEMNDIEWDIEQ